MKIKHSLVVPCYNEEGNVEEFLYQAKKASIIELFSSLKNIWSIRKSTAAQISKAEIKKQAVPSVVYLPL